MLGWLRRLFGSAPSPVAVELPPAPELTPKPLNFSAAIEVLRGDPKRPKLDAAPFRGIPVPPPGVRPPDNPPQQTDAQAWGLAFDSGTVGAPSAPNINVGLFNWATGGLWGEGLFFPGYPYLAELAQRPEYRHMTETIAEEMTRKWVKLVTKGDDDKTDTIATLEAELERFGCRSVWRKAIELDGFMGMGMIYISIKDVWDRPDELKMPLLIDKGKIEQGSLEGFVSIDPTWVSPTNYNATNPLRADFFKPVTWYVMGKEVHSSRLLIIRQREVPDILKPAYNFGGLSLSQMAKPYVDNWLRTRQSVSDLLHAFTVFVFKLDLQSLLQDATAFAERVQAFILGRDNRGLFMVDKEQEDFANVSAPLGGLDHLQAQAQEQQASVSKIPLVKLLGITPTGLNNGAADEIRVFYDHIHAQQEKSPDATLTVALQVIQLSTVGSIDEDIAIEWLPLWELDEAGRAAVQKTKADTHEVLLTAGVIAPEEARQAEAADIDSPYHGLKGPPPEPPELPEANGEGDDPTNRVEKEGAEGSESGANSGV